MMVRRIVTVVSVALLFVSLGGVSFADNGWNEIEETRAYSLGSAAFLDGQFESLLFVNPARIVGQEYSIIGGQFSSYGRNWQDVNAAGPLSTTPNERIMNEGRTLGLTLIFPDFMGQDWADVALYVGRKGYYTTPDQTLAYSDTSLLTIWEGDELVEATLLDSTRDFEFEDAFQTNLGLAWGYALNQRTRIGLSAFMTFNGSSNFIDESVGTYTALNWTHERVGDTDIYTFEETNNSWSETESKELANAIRLTLSAEYDITSNFRVGFSATNPAIGGGSVFYRDEFGNIIRIDSPPTFVTVGCMYGFEGIGSIHLAAQHSIGTIMGRYYSQPGVYVSKFEYDNNPEFRGGFEYTGLSSLVGLENIDINLRAGMTMRKLMVHTGNVHG